jgi:hypothetical protein
MIKDMIILFDDYWSCSAHDYPACPQMHLFDIDIPGKITFKV